METNNTKAMREALRLVSRVAVEMTRGTITREAPTRKEVDGWAMRLCEIIDAALAAPPHEANWTDSGGYEFACCSNCGHMQYAGWDSRSEQAEKIGEFHKEYKFCPNCGAKMRENYGQE